MYIYIYIHVNILQPQAVNPILRHFARSSWLKFFYDPLPIESAWAWSAMELRRKTIFGAKKSPARTCKNHLKSRNDGFFQCHVWLLKGKNICFNRKQDIQPHLFAWRWIETQRERERDNRERERGRCACVWKKHICCTLSCAVSFLKPAHTFTHIMYI